MNESTICIKNIFYMLCYAYRVLKKSNYMDILSEDFDHVEDLLAAILSRGVSEQVKRGLYKTYTEKREQTKSPHGRILPYETGRLRSRRIMRAECVYDELSEDNLFNQILKAAMGKLIRCPKVSLKNRNNLRTTWLYFQSVSEIELSSVDWSLVRYHRNNQTYEMLLNICRYVWQSLVPSTTAGTEKISLFEEDSMPALYEKFILEYYRTHFPILKANDDQISWDLPEEIEVSAIRQLPGMHSDITLHGKEKTLIIDAKYYRRSMTNFMGKHMLHSANIYQIYTYVKNRDKNKTGNVSGMLLYAKTTEDVFPALQPIAVGGNPISAQTLDLDKEFSHIAFSLDQIVYKTFGQHLEKR